MEYAGEDVPSKLGKLRAEMAKQGAVALVVSMLDEVAWAFNIRGCDVEFKPVTIAYGLGSESPESAACGGVGTLGPSSPSMRVAPAGIALEPPPKVDAVRAARSWRGDATH